MVEQTQRYSRQIQLPEIGLRGQKKLQQAKVLVIGVGGLGCPAAQQLVAAGVGKIGLVDHDLVDLSNLHRQLLFTESDLGQPKAMVAKRALQQLNSSVEIEAIPNAFTVDNALKLVRAYDFIIDGTDNFQTKYLINDACVLADKPWIYASIYKFQGQLAVLNYENGPTYRCLFPTATTRNVSCEVMGVLGVLPGLLGTLQAMEALKLILGIGTVLSGRLKMLDALASTEQVLTFNRREAQVQLVRQLGLQKRDIPCELAAADRLYLDVREAFEQPQARGAKVLRIPLQQLQNRHSEIPRNQPVYVLCQSGKRSAQAIQLLQQQYGFTQLINVEGGIQSIIQ